MGDGAIIEQVLKSLLSLTQAIGPVATALVVVLAGWVFLERNERKSVQSKLESLQQFVREKLESEAKIVTKALVEATNTQQWLIDVLTGSRTKRRRNRGGARGDR